MARAIDILTFLTSGTTGMLFGAVLVMILTNLAKSGLFGIASRWINGSRDKVTYGRRVLLVATCLSVVVTAFQWAALSDGMNIWLYILRVLGCALVASGGYEYVKVVSRPFAGKGDDNVGKG